MGTTSGVNKISFGCSRTVESAPDTSEDKVLYPKAAERPQKDGTGGAIKLQRTERSLGAQNRGGLRTKRSMQWMPLVGHTGATRDDPSRRADVLCVEMVGWRLRGRPHPQ